MTEQPPTGCWTVSNGGALFGPFASYEEAEAWAASIDPDGGLATWDPIVYLESGPRA